MIIISTADISYRGIQSLKEIPEKNSKIKLIFGYHQEHCPDLHYRREIWVSGGDTRLLAMVRGTDNVS